MIYFIIGTEAELIKMFPLMVLAKKRKIPYRFVATGQHKIHDSIILKLFRLGQPDATMYRGPEFTSMLRMVLWFLRCLLRRKAFYNDMFPVKQGAYAFVHGDTVSTLLGTFIARRLGIRVAHVEAGLRSFNIFHPFPEELTRRLVSKFADINFCPGEWAYGNLPDRVRKVNIDQNTLLDSLRLIRKKFAEVKTPKLPKKYSIFIYHRTENHLNHKLTEFVIRLVLEQAHKMPIVFIMHHTTENIMKKYGYMEKLKGNKRIIMLPRQSYPVFMKMLTKAQFIVTDGGSNQEECSYLGIPTLLLRRTTERTEGLGQNVILSKLLPEKIFKFYENFELHRQKTVNISTRPSERILDACLGEQALDV